MTHLQKSILLHLLQPKWSHTWRRVIYLYWRCFLASSSSLPMPLSGILIPSSAVTTLSVKYDVYYEWDSDQWLWVWVWSWWSTVSMERKTYCSISWDLLFLTLIVSVSPSSSSWISSSQCCQLHGTELKQSFLQLCESEWRF